ncbi:hypothetical protein BJX63DRAFT_264776 [Aspergillus granulosus]|uniref:Uncharacterized protein n=1 Tax=Aspergillus granulosus TaxID=176169 RepID=A0ABR4HB29_9EURO
MPFLNPPSPTNSSSSTSTIHPAKPLTQSVFIWIGIKCDDALKWDASFQVDNLNDLPKPAAYIAMVHKPDMQPTERLWYHCIGNEFDENDYNGSFNNHYHHTVNDNRWSNSTFCERVIPCGGFPVEKFDIFEKCFYATPSQNSGHFMIRFLRKLVQAGVLPAYAIRLIEAVIKEFERSPILDPKLEGDRVDNTPLPMLDEFEEQMMFDMEL